jgi:hypothetical protein
VRNGHVKWRWHREWRPRLSVLCARQRYRGISHVLGMPPLRYPEPAPTVVSPQLATASPADSALDVVPPPHPTFSRATLDATAALFAVMDDGLGLFAPPAAAAFGAATPGPQAPGSPPSGSRLPPSVTIAHRATTAPCTARPLATDSGSVADYFHENFVPLPVAGPRASGASAPTVASSLPPRTTVSSLPSGEPVVRSGEAVAPVPDGLPHGAPRAHCAAAALTIAAPLPLLAPGSPFTGEPAVCGGEVVATEIVTFVAVSTVSTNPDSQ